jgi:hypothetical protein
MSGRASGVGSWMIEDVCGNISYLYMAHKGCACLIPEMSILNQNSLCVQTALLLSKTVCVQIALLLSTV